MRLANPNRGEKEFVAELLQITDQLSKDATDRKLSVSIEVVEWQYELKPLDNTDLWWQSWWEALKVSCRVEGELLQIIGNREKIHLRSDKATATIHVVVNKVEARHDGTKWLELTPWRPWFVSVDDPNGNPLLVKR